MKVTWNRNGPASHASVYERVWNLNKMLIDLLVLFREEKQFL